MAKTAIVICSRIESKRLPQKPLIKYAGVPAIKHLITRLLPTNIPIVLAVPYTDLEHYLFLNKYSESGLSISVGNPIDPLERMLNVAIAHGLDNIIRITHDKIFIDTKYIEPFVKTFEELNLDYLYSSDFISGTGFEIISRKCLQKAYDKFQGKSVEHISYAAKLVSEKTLNVKIEHNHSMLRLLIDYPEDKKLFDTIFTFLSRDASLESVLNLVKHEPWIASINKLPQVTIYTCAYNGEGFLQKCIDSVTSQVQFKEYEYLLIDDGSTDKTSQIMAKAEAQYKNVRWIKNPVNLGLASSSNVALSHAKAPHIIRLDADDYFTSKFSVFDLQHEMWKNHAEVVYPDNYFGSKLTIQKGSDCHHIGGALFDTKAINFIKFTDGLKGLEGYDFFNKAKDVLKVHYYNTPTFFYSQREDSLSHTNLEERDLLKERLHGSNQTAPTSGI